MYRRSTALVIVVFLLNGFRPVVSLSSPAGTVLFLRDPQSWRGSSRRINERARPRNQDRSNEAMGFSRRS